MKIRLVSKAPRGQDLVIGGCFDGRKPATGHLPADLQAAMRRLAGRRDWRGRKGQTVQQGVADGSGRVVVLHGLGEPERFDAHALGAWAGSALRQAGDGGFRRITLVVPEHAAAAGAASALGVLRSAGLAGYGFGPRAAERGGPSEVAVLPPPEAASAYRRARRFAGPVTAAIEKARDLANTPPNQAHPEWMARQARAIGRERGMRVTVLGPAQMEKRGMGGLLAVGGGSARAPRLVRLAWGKGSRTVAVVGKGVTFDTGGISIKPSRAMDEMKFDKAGACAALAIAQGAADLDLPFRFRVYLPLAENMPGSRAYRPGDVVRCYGGKTVEVLNTDAEGRMILADALAWAAEDKPDTLIDLATLTGACVVALGHHGAGLFTPDEGLARELQAAADASGERLWRLPLWPEFLDEMRGRHADLRNSGGRWGGANTAAAFLSEFVGGAGRWAHIDIAGTSWVGAGQAGDFGATGYGVALALTWLLTQAGRLPDDA